MKVALLIPGYLRGFAEVYPYLRKFLIGPAKADVFITTYDYLGFNRNDFQLVDERTEDHLPNIQRLLRPKKVHILPRDEIINTDRFLKGTPKQLEWVTTREKWLLEKEESPSRHVKTLHTVLAMFRNVKFCNNLMHDYERDAKVEYTHVIRARADLRFKGIISMSDMHRSKDAVYVPSFINAGGVNDQFAFGTAKLMDKYCSLYDHIDEYFFRDKAELWPERLLAHHLKTKNVPVKYTDINFVIRRGNGMITDQRGAP